ncbi:RDD family protein [Streptomyces sp. ISID311]|uniref:RDD family protein n=1 Tax=Streptomyces sp. ISID311 TaxID=2601673 RepID=UPI0011BD43EB|nr:RDD family protein [Streptomyces sp. ISID311]TXC90365.1 RDD family protein [Streptomyces sp. ISID311]
MSELVTGEAVVLGLRPARLPSRGLAVAVDVAVAWVSYIGISLMLVSATSSMDSAAVAAVSVASFLLVQVGIPIVVETLSQGRSLGKVICGLRVVREDGGPIRFRHALVRGAMGAIEIVLTMGVVAAIASLVSARGRRLGDVFAGTLVIRERMPVAQAGTALPPPPPWLVAELGALDLSRVPDGWWLTVRQYLARMGQLDPQAGGAMAGRLAEDLRGFTGVPGPAGVHPSAYLAAVVGERQARESQRAFGASGVAGAAGVSGVAGAVRVERGEGAVVGPWDGATSPRVGVVGGVEAAASVGAWAPPGGGVGAPEAGGASAADEGPMSQGRGGGPVGVPGREPGGGGHDGGAGGGRERASRTGFAPPV